MQVTDILETYIETTRKKTQQVSEKSKSLRAEQQIAFEMQRKYVKDTVDETYLDMIAWKSFKDDFSKKITLQRDYVNDVS